MKYFGGKSRVATWIVSHFPDHRAYIEPFGGGASVLMTKPRSHVEIYNDLNSEIVNVFRVLRDPELAAELARVCSLTPWSRDELLLAGEPSDDPVEQARRTIFRSHAAFSPDKEGPWFRTHGRDARAWKAYPAEIPRFVDRLSGVILENRPAHELLERHDSVTTLFYLDPPYLVDVRRRRPPRVYPFEMDEAAHVELAELARSMEAAIVISGYHSELYERLYRGWSRHETGAQTMGTPWREVIWLNDAAVEGRHGLRLLL